MYCYRTILFTLLYRNVAILQLSFAGENSVAKYYTALLTPEENFRKEITGSTRLLSLGD